MVEIRLAKKGEETYQKNLWKVCFGDDDSYIDFYFSNKYKADETAVLLYNNEIAAMATMIPGKLVMPTGNSQGLAMLYAVATHPESQGKGFSTQIMEFCHKHLMEKGVDLSILVPAEESLFDFYSKRGYQEAFYIRETILTHQQIVTFKTHTNQEVSIETVEADDYNKRRRNLLSGNLYVDYHKEEIDYQKKISKKFGANLYGINIAESKGCAIIERINESQILIKEILMPDHLIQDGLKGIVQEIPAEHYMVRLPSDLGKNLGGIIKPFGMVKLYDNTPVQIKSKVCYGKQGYMGIAYD